MLRVHNGPETAHQTATSTLNGTRLDALCLIQGCVGIHVRHSAAFAFSSRAVIPQTFKGIRARQCGSGIRGCFKTSTCPDTWLQVCQVPLETHGNAQATWLVFGERSRPSAACSRLAGRRAARCCSCEPAGPSSAAICQRGLRSSRQQAC